MAVGLPMKTTYANGDVYSASDVNDITGTINTYVSTGKAAGVNKFINGDFSIWQRGTSISLTSATNAYAADRSVAICTFSAGTATVTRQTFTPGAAPVAGYEGQYFSRLTCGSTTTVWGYRQRIENVQTFAGQTVTLSFWIKASAANATTAIEFAQVFGSGGSTTVTVAATGPSITTSWQRFSVTASIPSVSGKTIGTSSYLEVTVYSTTGIASSLAVDTWGWQIEQGSTATAFQTASGSIGGELALCQRYYERRTAGGANYSLGINGLSMTTSAGSAQVMFASPKRTNPSVSYGGNLVFVNNTWNQAVTALNGVYGAGTTGVGFIGGAIDVTVASGLTAGQPAWLRDNGAGTAFIEFSSEL